MQLSEETTVTSNVKSILSFIYAMAAGLILVTAWVTLSDYKIRALEAKSAAIETGQKVVDKENADSRLLLTTALYELKAEISGLRGEIRTLNK